MNDETLAERLRRLPAVHVLLATPEVQALHAEGVTADVRRDAARELLDEARAALRDGAPPPAVDGPTVAARARRRAAPSLRRVINATGVVVHTNLGRAPLPAAAVRSALAVASGYCNLEYDLAAGARGHRHVHAAARLRALTGAEAALVTNNCAAAVLLALSGLAAGREVIVSRGELVEIGGAFRVPDILRQSGATLVEVGTTNRTRLADYRAAITERTAMLLKVHRSNFALVGFTEEVSLAELAGLGRETGLTTMMDLGSGLVQALPQAAFRGEPTAQEVVRAGVDLVAFSGDKLLGGPQAGLLVGRQDLVDRLARHPLLRALRPDKLTLALLEAVLDLHVRGRAADDVPVLARITEDAASVARRRDAARRRLRALPELTIAPVKLTSRPGGGTLPLVELPSAGLRLTAPDASCDALHARLRDGDPAVVGRVEDGVLLLDFRTVGAEEVADLVRAVRALVGGPAAP
jgi:L-seryl-tRNA(Ser) seleniumtransferase